MFRHRNRASLAYNSSKARKTETYDILKAVQFGALDQYAIALEDIKTLLRQKDISLTSIHLDEGATTITVGVQDADGGPFHVTLTQANSSFASWINLYPNLTLLHPAAPME